MTAEDAQRLAAEWPGLHPYTIALLIQAKTGHEISGKTIKSLLGNDNNNQHTTSPPNPQ